MRNHVNLPTDLDIDEAYDVITSGQEEDTKSRLKSKWSRIEALSGAEHRVHALATDIINHFETRQKAMKGKGMIVTMSRRIAVDLYDEIVRLKPEWHKRDNIKAKMRTQVRRLLKKYGYPPDLQKIAVEQVVEQAELMASQQ